MRIRAGTPLVGLVLTTYFVSGHAAGNCSWDSLAEIVEDLANIPSTTAEQQALEDRLGTELDSCDNVKVLHELTLFSIEKTYDALSGHVKILLNRGDAITVPSYMASEQLSVVSHNGDKIYLSPSDATSAYLFRPVIAITKALGASCPNCLFASPKTWISAGSKRTSKPETGFEATTPLCRSVQYGFDFLVELMLNMKDAAVIVDGDDESFWSSWFHCPTLQTTALNIAVTNNDTQTLHLLLDSMQDIEARYEFPIVPLPLDSFDQTPLEVARELGYQAIVTQIVNAIGLQVDESECKQRESTPKQLNKPIERGGWLAPDEAQEYHSHVHEPGFIAARVQHVLRPDMITSSTGTCNVERVHVSDLTVELVKKFVRNKQPFIVSGVTQDWELVKLLQRDSFTERFAENDFLVGRIPYGNVFGQMYGYASGSEFTDYLDGDRKGHKQDSTNHATENRDRFYIFDNRVVEDIPGLKESFKLPEAINQVFTNNGRHNQFMIGPHLSGSPIHFHCHAFNVVLYGRKRWLLVPPAQAFYTVTQAYDWIQHDDSSRYLHDPIPTVDQSTLNHPEVITCVQEQGELFYVPSLYGHAVLNEGENVAIAVEMATHDC